MIYGFGRGAGSGWWLKPLTRRGETLSYCLLALRRQPGGQL